MAVNLPKPKPIHLAKPVDAEPVAGSERFDPKDPQALIKTTARLVDEALDLMENAKGAGDRRTALQALREARDGLALLMRTAGMLQADALVQIDARKQSLSFDGITVDELRRLANMAGGDVVALPE